jgi:hypothetical protein
MRRLRPVKGVKVREGLPFTESPLKLQQVRPHVKDVKDFSGITIPCARTHGKIPQKSFTCFTDESRVSRPRPSALLSAFTESPHWLTARASARGADRVTARVSMAGYVERPTGYVARWHPQETRQNKATRANTVREFTIFAAMPHTTEKVMPPDKPPILLWHGAGVRLVEPRDASGAPRLQFEAPGRCIEIPGVYVVELLIALKVFNNRRRRKPRRQPR